MVYVFSTCDNEMFRYVFGALDEPVSIIVLPKSIENNYFARKLAHILWKFGIFIKYNFFGCEFNHFLCNIRPEDKVIFYARFPEHLFNVVPWLNSRVRVCLWMWDILDSIPFVKQKINIIKKLNIPIYTFDRKDAANYAIQYIPQLYNFKKPRNINEGNAGIQKCDVYFLGFPKDEYRMSWYKKAERLFQDNSIAFQSIMVDNTSVTYIGYNENLDNLSKCRAILELNIDGQVGLTLRTMESLSFRKKLITNNPHIKEYNFYRSNNIFILGEDNPEYIKDFLEMEYEDIPFGIIAEYDVNAWINKIFEK